MKTLCTSEQIGQYQSIIGDLQWAVSLGRIDIYCATITLGSYRASPRIGHLEISKRVYYYLRNYKKTSIKFRTDIPNYEMYDCEKPNWDCLYHT